MTEAPERYCGNCGNELKPEDQFCRNCGGPVHRAAHVPTPDAAPTQNIPTQVHAPPDVPPRRRNLTPAMMVGIGAALVLLLGVGSVAALTLLRGGTGSNEAAGGGQEPTEQAGSDSKETTPR